MTLEEIKALSDEQLVFKLAEAATRRLWQTVSDGERATGDVIRDEVMRRKLRGNLQPDSLGNHVWVWSA
jgi:hypothetical protein